MVLSCRSTGADRGGCRRQVHRDPLWIAALLLAGCGSGGAPSAPSATPQPTPVAARPNLVLVVADDLDAPTTEELRQLADLLADRGLRFTRAYATQPLCSPSRASILTGQYTHNHGVIGNAIDQAFVAFRRHEPHTIATWLKAAGYRTSLVGKYHNFYAQGAGEGYIPPGWDDWFGHLTAIEDERYWNYWVNDNGDVVRYADRLEDFSVDVEARRAVSFIHSSAGRPEPIFLYLAPQSPHSPARFPARFAGDFKHSLCPRPPSFNESNVDDKPSWVRQIEYMDDAAIDWADDFQRDRLRSMRAVEEEIAVVLRALAESGRLENTYVFFVSDNGLLMGQHRAVGRKGNAYEETIRIPFFVRGPGVPAGQQIEAAVLNIDLAPTLLELAGAPIPESVDGRSLVPFLRGSRPSSWRSEVLIVNHGAGPSYSLRTPEWLYNHQDTDELELYDMVRDPYQTQSLHRGADRALIDSFERRIEQLLACRGPSCR